MLVFITCSNSFGQKKAYFAKVYGAYGLFTPGSFKPVSYSSVNSQTYFKVPKTGLGGGVRIGAGLGMVLNDFLNLGIDGEYHIGNKISSGGDYSGTNYTYNNNTSLEYTILSIIPNITFKAISQPKYYIYTRLGPLIGIPLKMDGVYTLRYDNNGNVTDYYTKTKYELKTSLGYLAAIGVQVRISDAIRGFGEIGAYGLSFKRDRSVQTESYTENPPGSNKTPQNKTIQVYQSEGEYTTTTENAPDGTTTYTVTEVQDPVNVNAITISIGLAIKL